MSGTLALAFRYARRELRGGIRGLRIVLACLALGVAAIAAIGTIRAATQAGLAADGARILGGDVEIQVSYRPMPANARAWIIARGARLSEVIQMRAMAVAPSGARTLVELKAVDSNYPLVGELVLDPPGQMAAQESLADGRYDLVVDPMVAERLGVSRGALIRIGEASLTLDGVIRTEPDKITTPALLGPRAMIPLSALPATRLIQPGSLVQYEYRVVLPEGASRNDFVRDIRAAFPDGGWRIRTADAAAPAVNRWLDQSTNFLTLAGLTALLVGGIGVATGVRGWLDQRARTIATLRCLGAPARVIFATYLIQVLALALAGIALGLVLGHGLTWGAAQVMADTLPVPPRLGLYPAPLALAALYGLLTALAFALWPLGRAREIPGAALFRDAIAPARRWPGAGLVAVNAAVAALLVALIILTAERPGFAAAFCAGAVATLGLFHLGALGLMAAARAIKARHSPSLRLGLANLHRPGAPTALMLVSLGIGLSTLSAIAMIEGNLRRQLTDQLPAAAPSFFFIDIQSDQAARFDAVARALPGVEEVRRVPSLRARIVSVDGVPAEQVQATEETRWALRGDRGLTYAASPPPGSNIVEGQWWPADYRGAPLLSFDVNVARGWGVKIGSTIVVNVLGRDVPLKVANLREIDWRGLGLNFTLVASPGLLEAAPHTHIATLRGDRAQEGTMLRAITDAFPNVTGISVREAIEAVGALLTRIGTALSATASLTLLAGALVLAGAVAAGQRRRVRDAVILKTIGASRAQIMRAWAVEFGLLGATAGVIAAVVGTAASWGVVTYVMRAPWVFLPERLALAILGCVVLTLALGQLGTLFALRAKPAPLLRNE